MASWCILMAAALAAEPAHNANPHAAAGVVSTQSALKRPEVVERIAQVPRARNAVRGAAGPRGRRGQNVGGRVAAPAAARAANPSPSDQGAQDLIDLIQDTIAPSSWDVRGGTRTIRYFAPGQVLIVR